jgi:Glycosyltransferase sugar-binding region containing DXD motif
MDARDTDGRLPIVQYWDSEEVPDYLDAPIESFRELNPDMGHMLFSERTAADFIAARIGEREAAAFRSCAVPTMQSDYFRYCAVYALGGVYADAGFRCVAPLRTMLDGAGAQLFRIEPFGFLLSGFFAFDAPGHPLPRLVLDVITHNVERRASEAVQMVTGPWALSALSLLNRLGSVDARRQEVAEGGIERLIEPFRAEIGSMAPTRSGREGAKQMIDPLFEVVDDYARVSEAFEGVRILRYREASRWIAEPEEPLPYKDSDTYWARWQGRRTIFR